MSGEMNKRRDCLVERLILLQNAHWCSGITRQLESMLATLRQSHVGRQEEVTLTFIRLIIALMIFSWGAFALKLGRLPTVPIPGPGPGPCPGLPAAAGFVLG